MQCKFTAVFQNSISSNKALIKYIQASKHKEVISINNLTLTLLLRYVGYFSSSVPFTAAFPRNKSIEVPGGRRP